MKKGMFRIEITIKTPTAFVTQCFDLADYITPKEWIKAAKNWIKGDED